MHNKLRSWSKFEKTTVRVNEFECLKLTGINEHPVFTLIKGDQFRGIGF